MVKQGRMGRVVRMAATVIPDLVLGPTARTVVMAPMGLRGPVGVMAILAMMAWPGGTVVMVSEARILVGPRSRCVPWSRHLMISI